MKEDEIFYVVKKGTNIKRMNSEHEPYMADKEHSEQYAEKERKKSEEEFEIISVGDYKEKFGIKDAPKKAEFKHSL